MTCLTPRTPQLKGWSQGSSIDFGARENSDRQSEIGATARRLYRRERQRADVAPRREQPSWRCLASAPDSASPCAPQRRARAKTNPNGCGHLRSAGSTLLRPIAGADRSSTCRSRPAFARIRVYPVSPSHPADACRPGFLWGHFSPRPLHSRGNWGKVHLVRGPSQRARDVSQICMKPGGQRRRLY